MIADRVLVDVPDEPLYRARIRAHARPKVAWLRYLWTLGHSTADAGGGAHLEVDRILTERRELRELELDFRRTEPQVGHLIERSNELDEAWRRDPGRRLLAELFGLGDPELDLLALACGCAADPELGRLLAYLADEPGTAAPTAALAGQLFGWDPERAIRPDSAVLAWQLVGIPAETAWTPTTACAADAQIAFWLAGEEVVDPLLAPEAELVDPNAGRAGCLYPSLLDELQRAAAGLSNTTLVCELIGRRGTGRRVLAAQLAGRLGRRLLAVDAPPPGAPATSRSSAERRLRAVRSALLLDAILYWDNADGLELGAAPPRPAPLEILGVESRGVRPPGQVRLAFELPPLGPRGRAELWKQLRGEPPPAAITDWNLSAAEIVGAAGVADAGETAVVAACRSALSDEANELFTRLPQPFTWDDIVLPAATRNHLAEFEAQARLRFPVYEEWGFDRLCPLGRGVCALFAGPSGTGKTMAAQVLARSRGLEIYRVDLAGVVNKYIGETEKRLKRVFDACERADVLLLFDEADALFGQRTQVKDAHDRFANIEIDYLLQRMERFDGVAVLATNRRGDLDKAFLRRLRFVIEFMSPGPEERLTLWQKALPQTSPSGERLLDAIDFRFLADRLVMTAAEIKLAALAAAFQARDRGSLIAMEHVLAACRRELAKQGRELRGEPVR